MDHKLTVTYVYSRGEPTEIPVYTQELPEGTLYSALSPTIEYYYADIVEVRGVMADTDVDYAVVYSPTNDADQNGYADELEQVPNVGEEIIEIPAPDQYQDQPTVLGETTDDGAIWIFTIFGMLAVIALGAIFLKAFHHKKA